MSSDKSEKRKQCGTKANSSVTTLSRSCATVTDANRKSIKIIIKSEEQSPNDYSDESDARNSMTTTDSGNHSNTNDDSQPPTGNGDNNQSSVSQSSTGSDGGDACVTISDGGVSDQTPATGSPLPERDTISTQHSEQSKCHFVDNNSGDKGRRIDSSHNNEHDRELLECKRDNNSDRIHFEDDSDSQSSVKQSCNQFDYDQTSNSNIDHCVVDDVDDDYLMSNFDPTEVIKRMKVELKEEFDDNDSKEILVTHLNDIDSCDNSKHKDSTRNYFDYGTNGSSVSGSAIDNDYLRKLFGTFDLSTITDIVDSVFTKDSTNSSPTSASLAAFAAAATAVASSSLLNDSLDTNKRRLFQSLLLKQLNGSADPTNSTTAGDIYANNLATIGALLGDKCSPQQILSAVGSVSGLNGGSSGSSMPFSSHSTNNLLSFPCNDTNKQSTRNLVDNPEQRYCTSCNIQFKSIKTYKVR